MENKWLIRIMMVLSVIFVILQYIYSQIRLKTGFYNQNIRNIEYIIVLLLMLTTLIFVKKESSKAAFIKLLMVYIGLIILLGIFILKGAIK